MVKKDLTGLTFGRLQVLCEYGRDKHRNVTWLCQCNCGNFKIVKGGDLTSSNTKSCGCYQKECASEANSGENHPRYKDLTGEKFGRLTALYEVGKDKWGAYIWHCRCDCGNKVDVTRYSLTRGQTTSCGCLQKERSSETHKEDLTGLKFGRLTVLCEYGRDKHKKILWLCECSCGNFKIVTGISLTNGHTKSCGCYARECTSERASKQMGENHPNWQGGISFEPYCHKFNNKLKERIREKYGNKCLICGKGEEENGKRLSIHHVTYNKEDGCNGNGFKLIPLCTSCHSKTNYNRNFWEYYCKYLIKWYEWKIKQ